MFVDGFGFIANVAKLDDWPHGPRVAIERPCLDLLERSLRRGLSDVTRYFLHAAHAALHDARQEPSSLPVVFASAFGEIGTAEALLAQAYDDGSASPARFRNSVHNTAEGLLSISTKNRAPATALAAGWATVAMGLLEAQLQLASEHERLLLVFAEERVPSAFGGQHCHGGLAAGFVLSRSQGRRTRGRIDRLRRAKGDELDDPFGHDDHPLGPALMIGRALLARRPGPVRVSDGALPYRVEVTPLERR